ncbi:MAG: lipoate--protein ligase [Firmicutes bacterium]|nr:lipoate--protein ligase [Bacillota bacterium]
MIYIVNDATDPYFNLALEEYFLKHAQIDGDVLILWQNEPVIVVGKNQDPLAEINLDYVREQGIKVVRRITGGGAVYHDAGNINFSLIRNHDGDTRFAFFAEPVLRCLKDLGVDAVFSGRNDILVDGRKISGNAQCLYKSKVLHHGTLLWQSDLNVLGKALNPQPEKMAARGVKSVKSRVANISGYLSEPITAADFKRRLAAEFNRDLTRYEPTNKELEAIERLADSKYRTDVWNYGVLPPTDIVRKKRCQGGLVEARLSISGGVVRNIILLGDFFEGNSPLEQLTQLLQGRLFNRCAVEEALANITIADYMQNVGKQEFLDLLFDE